MAKLADFAYPLPFNAATFFRVRLIWNIRGQTALTTLWYGTTVDLNPITETGTAAVANAIKTLFMKDGVEDALADTISTSDKLTAIEVHCLDDKFDFSTPQPYTLTVNLSGLAAGTNLPPAANVAARFNYRYENYNIVANAPRRTTVAWPSVREGDVGEDGKLISNASSFYATKLALLAQDISPVMLETLSPIRVSAEHNPEITGGLILRGYSRVLSITPLTDVRWRRSRVTQEVQL